MRYLQFQNDEKSVERYSLLYLALVNSQKRNTLADLRTITDLTRALRSVGEETDKQGKVPLYELKDGLVASGGIVALEGVEFKMMKSLIESTPWSSGMAEQIVELNDWLERAPKDRPRVADDAKDEATEDAPEGEPVPAVPASPRPELVQ